MPTPDEVRAAKWHHVHNIEELRAFYEYCLPPMRIAAREVGYALVVHGSMQRDLDVIAIPWVEDCSDKDALAWAIQLAACGITHEGRKYQWEEKPHGRVATVFPICWPEFGDNKILSLGCVDLSVMTGYQSAYASGSAARRERDVVWMIERKAHKDKPAAWWTGGLGFGRDQDVWTTDAGKGIKFADNVSAVAAHSTLIHLSGIRGQEARERHVDRVTITEHMFVSPVRPLPKFHFDPEWIKNAPDDPEGCPKCGLIAGCCDDYPKCQEAIERIEKE